MRPRPRSVRLQAARSWASACHTQAVVRKFNLEGPVMAERHYCIPPLSRVNLDEILELIADMRYFVLHAPRQTGKTSTLLSLQDRLNAEGKYHCVYVNFEGGPSGWRGYRSRDADTACGFGFQISRGPAG